MNLLQNDLKEMYEEIERLKVERNKWKEEASKVEDKELRFDLNIKAQGIEKEIRNIKIEMMNKFEELIEWSEI